MSYRIRSDGSGGYYLSEIGNDYSEPEPPLTWKRVGENLIEFVGSVVAWILWLFVGVPALLVLAWGTLVNPFLAQSEEDHPWKEHTLSNFGHVVGYVWLSLALLALGIGVFATYKAVKRGDSSAGPVVWTSFWIALFLGGWYLATNWLPY